MISIIIPAYNEAENIVPTLTRVRETLERNDALAGQYEIIVVDDHSRDDTFEKVGSFEDEKVYGIRLSRRSGSHAAIRTGLAHAAGRAACCLSADGQDDPGALPEMIETWRQGFDIVWALRRRRRDEPLKNRFLAWSFYKLLSWLTPKDRPEIDLSRADFYLLDRKVVQAVNACPERNTSLFGLIVWLGFSQTFVEYDRPARRFGRSKWDFRSRARLAGDWIIAFSGLPLRIMTLFGFLVAVMGFLYALFIVFNALLLGSPVQGWPSLMAGSLVIGGVQMIMLGLLGEYLWRDLDETRSRPLYFIEKNSRNQTPKEK